MIRFELPSSIEHWLFKAFRLIENEMVSRSDGHPFVSATVATVVTADYTIAPGDAFLPVDATSGAVTITLPAITVPVQYTVKKIDSSANTVTLQGSENIDGAASAVITTQYASVTVVAGNGEWWIK